MSDALSAGCRVRLAGLNARGDLNGEEALLLTWIAEKERWAVRVITSGAGLQVRPVNMTRSMCAFDLLEDDSFVLVLAFTYSSSHRALLSTASRFRSALKLPTFLSDRIQLGLTEVSVVLDPPERYIPDDCSEEDEYSDDDDDDYLGYSGELECTRHFGATVRVDGACAGKLSATLIDRTICQANSVFFEACDAESQELIDVGRALFNSKGAPRYASLKADPSTHQGGFLYIKEHDIAARFRPEGDTGVVSQAITRLLDLPTLRNRWTVAAYIADGRDPSDRYRAYGMTRYRRRGEPATPEEGAARAAARLRFIADDCRPFVRLHFKEIISPAANAGWLYVTKTLLQKRMLSHQEALRVALRATTECEASEPQGLDADLCNTIRKAGADGDARRSVLKAVDQLVADGASVDRSCSLHCAAANLRSDLIGGLIDRGADVNMVDGNGNTALMIAAASVGKKCSKYDWALDLSCVDALIARGADISLTNPEGLSALGCYRREALSTKDFDATFQLQLTIDHGGYAVLEEKLRPPAGPTHADSAFDSKKFCAACGNVKEVDGIIVNLSACNRCLLARYCSRECQVAHWPSHKLVCKRAAKKSDVGVVA
jgi:hypothetical protein